MNLLQKYKRNVILCNVEGMVLYFVQIFIIHGQFLQIISNKFWDRLILIIIIIKWVP